MQYPNFYGIVEDAEELCKITHEGGAKFIMYCHPLALGALKSPGEIGADIAVGEGQPLGLGLRHVRRTCVRSLADSSVRL